MKRIETDHQLVLPYLFIVGIAVLRLTLTHLDNFVPIFTSLLFFGANRPKREFSIPLLVLIAVDVFLTRIGYGYSLSSGDAVTWIWYLVAMMLGAGMLRNSMSVLRAVGSSLLASVSFFLASNFAVWAAWDMYAKTWSGMESCYIAALPFFRNSLVSETACSALILGIAGFGKLRFEIGRMQEFYS